MYLDLVYSESYNTFNVSSSIKEETVDASKKSKIRKNANKANKEMTPGKEFIVVENNSGIFQHLNKCFNNLDFFRSC